MEKIIPPRIESCPDEWAARHAFINHDLKKYVPARCKRWSCLYCAEMNYIKVARLAGSGKPERFITLTRAGTSTIEINHNLKHLCFAVRRKLGTFEYFAVPELHANGQAHLHLLQRGTFVPHEWLSEKWANFTAGSYNDAGSFVVGINKINDEEHAKRYLLKYLRKSWQAHDAKSWTALQALYPGLNHYRNSRKWVLEPLQGSEGWQLVPMNLVEPSYQSVRSLAGSEPVLTGSEP